jgi:hypothetical protein
VIDSQEIVQTLTRAPGATDWGGPTTLSDVTQDAFRPAGGGRARRHRNRRVATLRRVERARADGDLARHPHHVGPGFGRASLIGSLSANLLAVPLVAPILWLGLARSLSGRSCPRRRWLSTRPTGCPASLLIAVAKAGAWLDTAGGSLVSAIGWLR